MKHRAIKSLCNLKDEQLFKEISKGLNLIYENSMEIWKAAKILYKEENYRGHRICDAFAREEAAKYLILLDALRCPRNNSTNKLFSNQLNKFNEHLAKGVYAKACNWKPDTYGTLCEYISTELDQYYLDGPEGADWVFRNTILAHREECIYVDYVSFDDEHQWITPDKGNELLGMVSNYYEPNVLRIIRILHTIGIWKIAYLEKYSIFWRRVDFSNETHYRKFRELNLECLKHCFSNGEEFEISEDDLSFLISEYHFPLYKEDMKEITREDLLKKS